MTHRSRVVVLLVLAVFAVGANIAWLNPRPGFEVYRTHDRIPFMWQYNADAGMEILSAAYFPHAFERYPQRLNRPLYPFAAHSIGNAIGLVVSPVVDLSPLQRAGLGYIVVKIAMHLFAGLALVDLLSRWLSPRAVLMALTLTFLHPHVIAHIATFHTTDLQVLVPIIVAWFAVRVAEVGPRSASTGPAGSTDRRLYRRRVVLYSLLTGLLMLGKQNYAVYLSVLAVALLYRRWREVVVSLAVHLVPLLLYMVFLRAAGLSYGNNEIEAMGQGVWVTRELLRSHPVTIVQTLYDLFWRFTRNALFYHRTALFLSVLAVPGWRRGTGGRLPHLLFAALLYLATWAQFVAVRRFDVVYLSADVSFVVFGLTAWIVMDRWPERAPRYKAIVARRGTILAFAVVLGVVNTLSFLHVPWVPPRDQATRNSEVLERKLGEVESRSDVVQ